MSCGLFYAPVSVRTAVYMSSCKNFFLSQGTLFTWDTFSDNTQRVNTAGHPRDTARRKREGTGFPVPSQKCLFIRFY